MPIIVKFKKGTDFPFRAVYTIPVLLYYYKYDSVVRWATCMVANTVPVATSPRNMRGLFNL